MLGEGALRFARFVSAASCPSPTGTCMTNNVRHFTPGQPGCVKHWLASPLLERLGFGVASVFKAMIAVVAASAAPWIPPGPADTVAGRVLAAIIAVMIYGISKFASMGFSWDNCPYTYIPVFGGVIASAGLLIFSDCVITRGEAKWEILVQFMPHLFALYLMGFLGVYAIYRGVTGVFSISSIIAGVFWIAAGYLMLHQLYVITELKGILSKLERALERQLSSLGRSN